MSFENMVKKMRENLSPMYDSPATFWEERLKINEKKLEIAQKRLAAAATSSLKVFWQRRVESAQRKVNYCRKRLANAKSPSGLRPTEIAERWKKVMLE